MDYKYEVYVEDDDVVIDYIGWMPDETSPWGIWQEKIPLCEGNITTEQINREIERRVEQNKVRR